jgi:hypothetical protein
MFDDLYCFLKLLKNFVQLIHNLAFAKTIFLGQ